MDYSAGELARPPVSKCQRRVFEIRLTHGKSSAENNNFKIRNYLSAMPSPPDAVSLKALSKSMNPLIAIKKILFVAYSQFVSIEYRLFTNFFTLLLNHRIYLHKTPPSYRQTSLHLLTVPNPL